MRYRRSGDNIIDATQWFKNGDHPDDRVGEVTTDPLGAPYTRQEGAVVRCVRPGISGDGSGQALVKFTIEDALRAKLVERRDDGSHPQSWRERTAAN